MNLKRKKSIFVVVPSLGIGGQEKMAVNTAELLMTECDVKLVVFHPDELVKEYQTFCPISNLNIPAGKNFFNKLVNAFRRAIKLRELVRSNNTDIVLSFGETANLTNALCGGKHLKIVSVRSYESSKKGIIHRLVYSRANAIVCCSKEIKNNILHIYPELASKTESVQNCYDVAKMQKLGAEPVADYDFSGHTIISHGRLERVKDYPRLIRAFSVAKNTVKDAKLLILGDGSQKEALQQLVTQLHMQDSVTLAGVRNNPFSYLSKASLYVLSSLSEGFPNALIEGMTFLPVIAADCKSGPREILSDGPLSVVAEGIEEAEYGILVKPINESFDSADITPDDEVLAKAMIMMLTNHDLAEKYKSAAHLRANVFSFDAYRAKLEKVLESYTDV